MANRPKKEPVDNTLLLQQIQQSTDQAINSSPTSSDVLYMGSELRDVNIDLMDDAPEKWNKYFPNLKELDPAKYLEIKLSIYNHGVAEPIILWAKEDGRYMVLAGHTRRDICREIIVENKDNQDFDPRKYQYVGSKVYGVNALSDLEASDIVILTNILHRPVSERTMIQIIKDRQELTKEEKYKGKSIVELCEGLELKKSAIYQNLQIANDLIEPIQQYFFAGRITKKAALSLVTMDKMKQQWIFDHYAAQITSKRLRRLKRKMTENEIAAIFEGRYDNVQVVALEVPKTMAAEVKELVKKFLEEKGVTTLDD